MSKDFTTNPTSKIKVDVYLNADGNILQPGETIAGKKTVTFPGFASSITASEAVNAENSPALHNGVAALMWLFTGSDEGNFDEFSVIKTTTEIIEED